MMRKCGECVLCCKLLPMKAGESRITSATAQAMMDAGLAHPDEFVGMLRDFDKPAGARCPHQRHHKGCAVYASRPFGCRVWNCRWLVENDVADIRRPDRCHYVIDLMPDFIDLNPHDGSARIKFQVVVVWVDPDYPDAWRDPPLLAYMERRAAEGLATLLRFSSSRAVAIFPPAISSDRQWHEVGGTGNDRLVRQFSNWPDGARPSWVEPNEEALP